MINKYWMNYCNKKKFNYFGKNAKLGDRSIIGHGELISIGNNTKILDYARLQCYPELVETVPSITIGKNCFIGYYFTILSGATINIGDNVLIASNVLISSENHGINPECSIPYMGQKLECKPVNIGEGCWIGEKVCILPGVKVGEKSIIGAGSVVTKSIPAFSIAVGNPAKVIKRYNFVAHEWENINK